MAERESQSFPTNHISREDLVSITPTRKIAIDAFTDEQMEQIANEIGEAISDVFWVAVAVVLDRYMPLQEQVTTVDNDGD